MSLFSHLTPAAPAPDAPPRIVIVTLVQLLSGRLGWPLLLLHNCPAVIPLVAVRPPDADPVQPNAITSSIGTEPALQVGTIDELVAAYRAYLEAAYAEIQADPEALDALTRTVAAYGACPSGTMLPMFRPPT
jgi:hypothetical protein